MGKIDKDKWRPRQDIVEARNRLNLSQIKLARLVGNGCSQSVIGRLESGETEESKYLERVETILGIKKSSRTVPVIGTVGAGSVIWLIDGQEGDTMLTEVQAPPEGYSDTLVAVRVAGDSMLPQYKKGALIFYDRQIRDFDHLLGETLIVRTRDGRSYIKALMRGTNVGKYTLFSYNGDLIENVEVEWVAEIEWVRPKG